MYVYRLRKYLLEMSVFTEVVHVLIYFLTRLLEIFWYKKKCVPLKCLVGKTAIVTGGNSGIGYSTAMILASRGCRVILADCQNGEKSKDQIIASTDNKEVIYKYLDLSSLQSVRSFAAEICRTENKIDILINNAGIALTRKTVSEDGLNYLMQVNIFGAFLLTHLLLEPLKKSQNARVIFISSLMMFLHDLTLDTLNVTDFLMDDTYRRILYSNSKVCCIFAGQEFGKKLQKFGITANSVDPFAVKTSIFKTFGDYEGLLATLLLVGLNIFAKDPLEVANAFVQVITKDDPHKTNGKNFVLTRIGSKPEILRNKQFCEDVWCRMEELVKLKPNEKIGYK